jgi:hypothetical protein
VEIINKPTCARRFSIHCQLSGARLGNTAGSFARMASAPRNALPDDDETGAEGAVEEDELEEVPAGL